MLKQKKKSPSYSADYPEYTAVTKNVTMMDQNSMSNNNDRHQQYVLTLFFHSYRSTHWSRIDRVGQVWYDVTSSTNVLS